MLINSFASSLTLSLCLMQNKYGNWLLVIKTPLTGKLPTHAHTYAQKPIGSVRMRECILCLVSCICAWKYFHNKQQAFVRCRCTGKRHSVVIAVQPQEMLLLSACPCAQRGLTRGELWGGKGERLRLAAVLTATLSVLKMKINRHMQQRQRQPKRVCKGCRRGTLTTHNLHASVAFAVETSFFWQPLLSPSLSLTLSGITHDACAWNMSRILLLNVS